MRIGVSMKKILMLFASLLMVFSLFAGCGYTGEETDAIKVGFIYIGSVNDGGFTQAHDTGRIAMEQYFEGEVTTAYVENVSENSADVEAAALSLIDQGCNVIVGTSYGFMDALDRMAPEYPDVYFLHFSGNKMNDTNFSNYFGAMEEPRYLSGMLAGMMTKTDMIGYVAAFPYTEVQIGINAFALGVQSVNPDAIVKVVYINSWYDPAKETEAAESLLAVGCDVLTQHCDTTGPQIAAEEAGAYAIGYNLANPDAAPGAYLTAPIWNHSAFLIKVIESIQNGTFETESYYGTMADGYVMLAPMSDLVSDENKALVEDKQNAIINSDFAVFSGKIYNADGTVLCEEGQTLTREQIWQITQVIQGVQAIQ